MCCSPRSTRVSVVERFCLVVRYLGEERRFLASSAPEMTHLAVSRIAIGCSAHDPMDWFTIRKPIVGARVAKKKNGGDRVMRVLGKGFLGKEARANGCARW